MLDFLLSFFFLAKASPPSTPNSNIYYIDLNFENLYYKPPSFCPIRANYRISREEFEEAIVGIRFRTHKEIIRTRILRLMHIIITFCWLAYLILFFSSYGDYPISYVVTSVLVWICLVFIIRIFRTKTLRKEQKAIDLYLKELNRIKYNKRGLHWKITLYAQYLALDLAYTSHEFSIPLRVRSSIKPSAQGSITSLPNINGSTPLLSENVIDTVTPKHGSFGRSTRSDYGHTN